MSTQDWFRQKLCHLFIEIANSKNKKHECTQMIEGRRQTHIHEFLVLTCCDLI